MNYIHKKSNIEGEVDLGDGVSVWPFASIRGDEGLIKIGDNTSIQDSVTVHGKTTIGNNVTVGHNAIIHGAKIGDNVLIGMNSTILDDVEIADWCIIAAGSVIPPHTKIESESLVMGVPGRVVRKLESNDKEFIISSYKNYLEKIKQKQK
jgi:carbonic anhydrase/acetyltransferase-like protein (isoleucine patch superfamily)